MRTVAIRIAATLATLATAFALPAKAEQGRSPACTVWEQELAFAQAAASGDEEAFARFLAPDAVFSASWKDKEIGRKAILAAWAPYLRGTPVRVRWYPRSVAIAAHGQVAISSGPALFEQVDETDPLKRFRVGKYVTTWIRDGEGWRIAFDDGTGLKAASLDQVRAFEQEEAHRCVDSGTQQAAAPSSLFP